MIYSYIALTSELKEIKLKTVIHGEKTEITICFQALHIPVASDMQYLAGF